MTPSPQPRQPRSRLAAVTGLADALSFPAAVLDPEGCLLHANPSLVALLARPAEQLVGHAVEEFVAPEDRARFRQLVGRCAEAESVGDVMVKPARKPRCLRVALRRTAQLAPDTILLTAFDLSPFQQAVRRLEAEVAGRTAELAEANDKLRKDLRRREEAEAALRRSEAKFATAFQMSPDAITLTTLAEGQILDVNETFLRLLGYTREEVLGRTTTELGIWADPAERDVLRQEIAGGRAIRDRELRFLTKAGESLVGAMSAEVVDLQGEPVLLTVTRDISSHIRTEAALRESEQRAREQAGRVQALLDATPALIWVALDRECRTIIGNRAACEFSRVPEGTNLSKSGPVPERLAHYRVFHDGVDLPPEEMPLQRVAASGQALRDYAMEFVFDDGTVRSLVGNVSPILDAEGKPTGALAAFLDITERKQGEEQLRKALADKEAALATNQTLLREVHHRTKNNLQMLCDLMYLQMEAMPDGDQHQDLQDAYSRIYAIARLHEHLYHSMRSGHVKLRDYLGQLASGFEDLFPRTAIRIQVPPEPIYLDVDRAIHVGLIANELLTNAVKHAFPNGEPGEVVVDLRAVGGQVELQVTDTGKGLPADFDLTQAKTLGLRIVHILAARLHGTVRVVNEGGATFTVRFPIRAEE